MAAGSDAVEEGMRVDVAARRLKVCAEPALNVA